MKTLILPVAAMLASVSLVALLVCPVCTGTPGASAPPTPDARTPVAERPAPLRGTDYRLVFDDEFDGPAGAPASKERWSAWSLGKRKDAFNVADTCRLDGEGHLVIEVRRANDRIETGGVTTFKKFSATHGYYECRAKVHAADGAWSAFWLQSPSIGKPVGDATHAGVEIDVMEYFPGHWKFGKEARHTAHWDGYGKDHKVEAFGKTMPDIAADFHTFAVKWDETGYVFYIDGSESGRWKGVPIADRPEYMILSCEAQKWSGDIAKAKLPAYFVIDYVRLWQTPAQIGADKARKGK